MTGELRGHIFVWALKQGRRGQRKKLSVAKALWRGLLSPWWGETCTACRWQAAHPNQVAGFWRGSLFVGLRTKLVMQLLLTLCPGNR